MLYHHLSQFLRRWAAVSALALTTNAALAAPGDVDTSFGNNGRVFTAFSREADPRSMAVLPNGKIVVGGEIKTANSNNDEFLAMRYNADGTLDPTFDGDGIVSTYIGTQTSTGYALALQPDGKIIIAGVTVSNFNGTNGDVDVGVVRYNTDGSLDTTFGNGGRVITDVDGNDQINAAAVMPNGKIALAGTVAGGKAIGLVVLNADGTLDTGFSGDGKTTLQPGSFTSYDARAVAVQPDNKIVVAGNRRPESLVGDQTASLIARFNPDGTLDTAFNNTGIAFYDLAPDKFDTFNAVVIAPDGTIIVSASDNDKFIVGRLNHDGSPHAAFGENGFGSAQFGALDNAFGIAVQPDGKIVQFGVTRPASEDADFALACYTAAGQLDAEFSDATVAPLLDGQVVTDFQNGSDDVGQRVGLQPDGKIVVFGNVTIGEQRGVGLVRYIGSPAAANGRLLNISTRTRVEPGDKALIGGFIITGDAPKKVLIRGMAPSLERQGVVGALQDPVLDLDNGTATNDDWKSDQQSEIEASTIPPSDDREAAIVATLQPGPHTAILSGKGGATGVGLVEVYDLETGTPIRLANISTRGFVQTGNNVMIGGFIIGGNSPAKVLLRAIGPSLANEGVSDALQDPTLELVDPQGNRTINDNWRTSQEAEIRATTVAPSRDEEAAILATLVPGAYTAVLRGKDDAVGVALVEAFNLQ